MKHFALFLGLASLLVASCSIQEEDISTPILDDVVFYASFEQPAEVGTRVYANEDLLLRWTADDRVSIFNKITYNQQYVFTGETGDNAGGFRKVDTDEFVTGNAISHVVSIYPYQETIKITESEVITANLPAEQAYAENTFGLGANTMVSVSSDNVLQYKNVGGYLMLKLYGEGVSVSSITLKGNNGEKLAGKSTITMPLDGTPSVTLANDATTELILNCATQPVLLGATSEESTQFWFVVPPVTFSKGFTIIVNETTGGVFEKSTSKSITIERNKLSKMSPMEVEKNMPSGNIAFADVIAKYACVEKFDVDGDGEVSFKEAENAQSLEGLFTNWPSVSSFDEIRFFTNVTSTEGVFTNLQQLKSISIPNNITTLGTFENCTSLMSVTLPRGLSELPTKCFKGCSSLVSIILPEGIISIPDQCFYLCESLVSVALPDQITTIGKLAFSECSALEEIQLPSALSLINNGAFSGCFALIEVDLPQGLKTIEGTAFNRCGFKDITIPNGVSLGSGVFSGCKELLTVALPNNLSILPDNTFYNCEKLESVKWPVDLKTIEQRAFYGCSFASKDYSLELPLSVNNIGERAFDGLHHLIIPSTSPVTIADRSLGSTISTLVYVPANMLEMYKVRANWNYYREFIRPLGDYPAELGVSRTVSESVDLGLSVKWASWNIGASAPEESGAFFAWGETDAKWEYSWPSYQYCNGNRTGLTKYCTSSSYGSGGFTDYKTVLEDEDDAAAQIWGGGWRMPTREEMSELYQNCTWTAYSLNGIEGFKVSSNKEGFEDKWIFLPKVGTRGELRSFSSYFRLAGIYWSSSLNTYEVDTACNLVIEQSVSSSSYRVSSNSSGSFFPETSYRYLGGSIRAVISK